jgi:hypothetical protein
VARTPKFGSHVVACLTTCWMLTRTPAGKRLAPMLATIVHLLRRDGDIIMTDTGAALLVSMSVAIIDRHLNGERAKLFPRGRSHTKPGTVLKSQILIRTWPSGAKTCPGSSTRTNLGTELQVSRVLRRTCGHMHALLVEDGCDVDSGHACNFRLT